MPAMQAMFSLLLTATTHLDGAQVHLIASAARWGGL